MERNRNWWIKFENRQEVIDTKQCECLQSEYEEKVRGIDWIAKILDQVPVEIPRIWRKRKPVALCPRKYSERQNTVNVAREDRLTSVDHHMTLWRMIYMTLWKHSLQERLSHLKECMTGVMLSRTAPKTHPLRCTIKGFLYSSMHVTFVRINNHFIQVQTWTHISRITKQSVNTWFLLYKGGQKPDAR